MVIDGHCHILPPGFAQRRRELMARDATFAALFPSPKARLATTEGLLAAMDEAAVAQAVVIGMGWSDAELAREANDYLAQAVARYPDRLTGFCSVSPAWGEAAVAEVERCAAARLRGIGELHPDTQGFDITDKLLLAPLMDTARGLRLPVLVHASEPVGHQYPGKGRTTPGKLYRFIQNFPNNTIICAHWGGGLPFYALMPEAPRVLQNVYFDTAASPYLYRPEVFPTVVGLIGADKVIFGTDYPIISHQRLLAQVERAGLDPAARGAILGGNIARLLGM
jgi:hypothetical protein